MNSLIGFGAGCTETRLLLVSRAFSVITAIGTKVVSKVLRGCLLLTFSAFSITFNFFWRVSDFFSGLILGWFRLFLFGGGGKGVGAKNENADCLPGVS